MSPGIPGCSADPRRLERKTGSGVHSARMWRRSALYQTQMRRTPLRTPRYERRSPRLAPAGRVL